MSTSTARRSHQQSDAARQRARTRIRDARLALSEPAHVIAERSRARFARADTPARIPSKKPRLVSTPARHDRSFVWVMRFFGVGVVVSLLVVVGIQTTIAKRQITIDNLRGQQQVEVQKFESIRQDVANLKSPDRITRRANYLGLVQPTRFISISIPMAVSARSDQRDEELWSEVKAIVNDTP